MSKTVAATGGGRTGVRNAPEGVAWSPTKEGPPGLAPENGCQGEKSSMLDAVSPATGCQSSPRHCATHSYGETVKRAILPLFPTAMNVPLP